MKRIIRLVLIAAAVASFSVADLAAAPAGANPPGSRTLSIYSDNPAYFESPDGRPVVMIGDYEASPTAPTGIPIDPNSDFVVFFDTLKASHLNFAKLGVISPSYRIDFYGPETSSPLIPLKSGVRQTWMHVASR